ncbi:MAG: S1/P1 nuclease [Bdellovibrionales bacterium]|nr:S1/P1 nuclease [Bdellovibrionales bacterium]
MKIKLITILVIALVPGAIHAWSQIGHRVVGQIAENHLNKESLKKAKKLLGHESLAEASSWADFIKSETKWKKANPWHYVTISEGKSYKDMKKNKDGDVVWAINHYCKQLKNKKSSKKDKTEALKFLIHFVGDVHQPLHVGTGHDRGGNEVKIEWFGETTNLHRVWDDLLIKMQDYSYTEYTKWIDHASKKDIKKWRADTIETWLQEAMAMRQDVYDIIKNKDKYKSHGEYKYNHKNIKNLNKSLLKAGLRLAAKIDECL